MGKYSDIFPSLFSEVVKGCVCVCVCDLHDRNE